MIFDHYAFEIRLDVNQKVEDVRQFFVIVYLQKDLKMAHFFAAQNIEV
jgi:hypothetical protein